MIQLFFKILLQNLFQTKIIIQIIFIMSLQLYDNFSFGQSQLVYDHTIGCLSGGAFYTMDSRTGKKDQIWSERNGFQTFASNNKRGLVVLAEQGLNPSLYVYRFPEKKLLAKIPNASVLQILKLIISRDGKRLMVVNGVPEYNIVVWDLESQKPLGEIELQTDLTFLNVKFSPKDTTLIAVLYKECLQICSMEPYFVFKEDEPQDHNRFSVKEYASSGNYAMVWNETNLLYLSSEGKVAVVDPANLEEIYSKKVDVPITHMILTPKHLIAVNQQNHFEFMYKYDKLYNDEELTPFLVDKTYHFTQGNITGIQYSIDYQDIFAYTQEGQVYTLDIPAETFVEDDEDENENNKNAKKRDNLIKCTHTKVVQYFTSGVIFVKELKTQDVLVAISANGECQLWNTKEKILMHQLQLQGPVTSADISANDRFLVLGGQDSCIQVVDLKTFGTVKVIRLFKKQKPISQLQFQNGDSNDKLVAISTQSKKVFVLKITEDEQVVMGYQSLCDHVISVQWHASQQIICLVRSLVFAISPPEVMNNLEGNVLCRKTDPEMTKICLSNTTDIYLTGADKVLKRYKFPEEKLEKIDLKVKLPALSPLEEVEGHFLPVTAIQFEKDLIVSGCQDGEVMIRHAGKMNEKQKMKVMNFKYNGVKSLYYSSRSQLIFVGGDDGSLMVLQYSDPVFIKPAIFQINKEAESSQIDFSTVKDYHTVMIEEQNQAQSNQREKLRNERYQQILQIKEKLQQILSNNAAAEEPDQLDRQEIVIDIKARDEIIQKGETKKLELRQSCELEKAKNDIIFNKIKNSTWDKMNTHLKSINGLQSDTMIFNYHMRIEEDKDTALTDKIIDLRRMEVKEKLEQKQKEMIDLKDVGKKLENYVVNAFSGKPVYVLNDYEKKDETQEKGKGDLKRGGKRATIVEDKAPVETQQNLKPEEKKNIDDFQNWDFLYSAFELFSNPRKTNQIYMLKRIIQEIKKDFNKEFEQMVVLRQNQVDQISERNKRIQEILSDLQKPADLFVPKRNYLEDVENILTVDSSEIPFEKYLSKDERAKLEQQKLKEEQRQRELAADDSGFRALKDMMNGTLEVKKENILAESLTKEEWMNKPVEEMTDDEKIRLREYEIKEQKQNEEKEKIRKNLENELKKLRGEIQEICTKFDEKLSLFLKRKLEFDQRVSEQQLQIIKLTTSIMNQRDSKVKNRFLQNSIQTHEKNLNSQRDLREKLGQLKDQVDQDFKVNQENFNQQLDSRQKNLGFDVNKVRNIYVNVFEDSKKDEKKRMENEQKIINNPKYKSILIPLDPYLELEKNDIKLEEESQFNNFYDEIIEKINNLQLDDENKKEQIIDQLNTKYNLKKSLEQTESKRQRIAAYIDYFDKIVEEKSRELSACVQQKHSVVENLNKNLLDIEVQIRLKQGIVEVSQQKPIQEDEVVLVQRDVIERKNEEIMTQGTNVIKQMKDISNTRLEVAKKEHELKIQDLRVRDLELKTKEVQMLKVKKEMQQALTKKDTKLNEFELHNLQEQIEKVIQTTEKRIQIYKKKEEKINKDIEFIVKETEQLKMQGSSLDDTVKQRKEISEMMFRKNQDQTGARSDNENFEKFKKIQYNRKLYDLVKRQTEEIELLKEELQRLKLKTFADFSSVR